MTEKENITTEKVTEQETNVNPQHCWEVVKNDWLSKTEGKRDGKSILAAFGFEDGDESKKKLDDWKKENAHTLANFDTNGEMVAFLLENLETFPEFIMTLFSMARAQGEARSMESLAAMFGMGGK